MFPVLKTAMYVDAVRGLMLITTDGGGGSQSLITGYPPTYTSPPIQHSQHLLLGEFVTSEWS